VNTYQRDQWSALADPSRRAIFEALADHPLAVGELAARFPISRPAVSQHLKILRGAGLAQSQRHGNRVLYRVDVNGVNALRAYLDQFWKRALAGYKNAVEQQGEIE
jgi:DNA-binding transcriptional ArsR family regulator